MLDPRILKHLIEKTGHKEKTVRNELSEMHQSFPGLTLNQVAQIYALKNGTSIKTKLTMGERATFPNLDIQKPITVTQKNQVKGKKKLLKVIIRHQSTDRFMQAHIDEVNRCYTFGCYTAAFILCRKIIENMLTDIIKKKFPQNSLVNIELYFDTKKRRTRDFSEIVSNLKQRASDFGPDQKLLERALSLSEQFKDDANDKTHSLFHVVRNASELENKHIQDIVDMLVKLEKNIK